MTTGQYDLVEGVAALNLGSSKVGQFFDCLPSNQGLVNNIRWVKKKGVQRFPVTTETVELKGKSVRVRRMNFAPLNAVQANHGDTGVYTCILNNEAKSINISGGEQWLAKVRVCF